MQKSFLKDIAVYGSSTFFFKLISFLIFPVYAHIFSLSQFGILSLVASWAGIIATVLSLGINNAVQRFYFESGDTASEYRTNLISTSFWMLLLWSIIVTLITLAVIKPYSNNILENYEVGFILIFLGFLANIPRQILAYGLDILRLKFSPWKYTIVTAVRHILTIAAILVFIIILDQGLKGFFLGELIGITIACFISFKFYFAELKLTIKRKILKEVFSFGYPFIFTSLAYWIFNSLDKWMLASMTNNTEVGLYSIGFKFATIIVFINQAFGSAWSPYAFKLYSEEENYKTIYATVLKNWFAFLTLIGLSLAFFSNELLMLTTPEEYWDGASVICILSLGIVYFGTTQITGASISLSKKTKIFTKVSWIVALINTALNFVLIPYLGANGAALATVISYLILTILYYYYGQKVFPIKFPIKKLSIIASMGIFGCCIALYINSLDWEMYFILVKSLLLLLYVLVIFSSKIIDKEMIIGLLKKTD